MIKILVIGKNGQLGNAIQQVFDKSEINLFSFDKKALDILDIDQVRLVLTRIKPSIVINTSAFHQVSKCELMPQEAFSLNCIAVGNLARLCSDLNMQFITYSTDYVFDGTKKTSYKENERPNPLQMYGLSKLAGEYAALNLNPEKTYIIRTNGLYGGKTGSRSKGGNFVLSILRDALLPEDLRVTSEYFANPTSAIDLAVATLDLVNKKGKGGVYHLASEGYCSWYDFAKKIVKFAGLKKEILPALKTKGEEKFKRPKFSVLANTTGKSMGISLPNWENSLKRYVQSL